MGTTTSRAQLYKPAEVGEVIDVALLNGNMDKIDALLSTQICTSGTRPPSPFDGQLIRETDTDLVWVWDAGDSKWRLVSGPASLFFQGVLNVVTGNGTPWGIGNTSSIDAAKSKNASVVGTINTLEKIQVVDDGVYSGYYFAQFSAGVGAWRAYADISVGSETLARSSFYTGEDRITASFSPRYFPAGTIFTPTTFQLSGGNFTRATSWMVITRQG